MYRPHEQEEEAISIIRVIFNYKVIQSIFLKWETYILHLCQNHLAFCLSTAV